MKKCAQCKLDFEISDNDSAYYKKIHVPEPKFCPKCRSIIRMGFRNERTLYKRVCNLCHKDMVSTYSPNSEYKVFCPNCWHNDAWDAFDFGMEFSFSRPFFEQFHELKLHVPRIGLDMDHCENSDYSNISFYNKNCYLVFGTLRSEECMYTRKAVDSRSSLDSNNIYNSELCYECINCFNCYNVNFAENCGSCTDSNFLRDCVNCRDCMFCVALKNKQYCWKNQQLSKEEYQTKKVEFLLNSFINTEKAKQLFQEFSFSKPFRCNQNINCENCTGNYLHNSRNCINCFDIWNSQDCKWCTDALEGLTDSMDCTSVTMRCTFVYESANCSNSNYVAFSNLIRNGSYNIYYSDSIHSSHDLFGCIGLKRSEYCVLNKKYSPEEYKKLVAKIIEHMNATGEFGDFFPHKLSPYGYNETLGNEFAYLPKEKALQFNLRWNDEHTGTFGKETTGWEGIHDMIEKCDESITDQVLACEKCKKNFKIIKQELAFYKNKKLALPHKCPDCRNHNRISKLNSRNLWKRRCMSKECSRNFETTYSPERQEKVFCEECYQEEIV